MPVGTTRARELDDKEIFYLWIELKNFQKVGAYLVTHDKLTNPKTGHAYHPSAVRNAAWRYAIEHQAEAREALIGTGWEYIKDDTNWNDCIVQKAWTRWNSDPTRFVEWMDKSGYDIERYSYLYKDYLGMVREYQKQYNEKVGK
ncbi:MAG: hypothetical protein WC554_10220 [Clostridia bacterium]